MIVSYYLSHCFTPGQRSKEYSHVKQTAQQYPIFKFNFQILLSLLNVKIIFLGPIIIKKFMFTFYLAITTALYTIYYYIIRKG